MYLFILWEWKNRSRWNLSCSCTVGPVFSLISSSSFLFNLCVFGLFLGLGCRALIRFCLPFQAGHCIICRSFCRFHIKVPFFSLPSFQFSQPKWTKLRCYHEPHKCKSLCCFLDIVLGKLQSHPVRWSVDQLLCRLL